MTTITIIKAKNGNYKRVVCEGHAGFAEAGSDVVCSAISVLVINTINSLGELARVPMEIDSDEDKGLIDCRFMGTLDERSVFLLDSMVFGLKNVVSQYGRKYLKLKFREV